MLSAKEAIERQATTVWIHNLEILQHILQRDTSQTYYQNPDDDPRLFNHLMKVLGEVPKVENARAIEAGFNRLRSTVEIPSEQGALSVERYLDGDALCFDEPIKRFVPKVARTVIMDGAVPYAYRRSDYVARQCEQIYKAAVEAEEKGEPFRVIVCFGVRVSECRELLKFYIVVKDYTDPIFPAIWSILKRNDTMNDFSNCIADYFIGTRDYNNGRVEHWRIGVDIPEDEDVQFPQPNKFRR